MATEVPIVKVVVTGAGAPAVSPEMVAKIEEAAQVMVEKSLRRGDAWRSGGVLGAFMEIHQGYNRLRRLVWDGHADLESPEWQAEVANVAMDLRNYTMLLELSAGAGALCGDGSEGVLQCKACGRRV